MASEPQYVKSVSEYLDVIACMGTHYPSAGIFTNPTKGSFLYRGIACDKYKLTPGIFRRERIEIEGFKDGPEKNKYLENGNEFGILCDFIKEASAFLSQIPTDDYLHWAEVAQHYGAPTRFLDWTTNPLVALYFACTSQPKEDGIVWLLHEAAYETWENRIPEMNAYRKSGVEKTINRLLRSCGVDEDLPKYPLLITPHFIDSRMAAQSSRFMVWGSDRRPFEEMIAKENMMLYPEAEVIQISPESLRRFVYKIGIRKMDKHKLQRELERIGASAKSFFPGLDGVGQYIEMKYHFNYGEDLITNF